MSVKQQRHVAGGMGGESSIDRMEKVTAPTSATRLSLITAAPRPAESSRITPRAGKMLSRLCPPSNLGRFAWALRASTVRAFSNRYLAQTSTQSVVRIAVARRVLSMSETARFAQTSSARKPRGPLRRLSSSESTEESPKNRRGATARTLHGFASLLAF